MEINKDITVVNPELQFDKVSLVSPSGHRFIMLAAEVDSRFSLFFLWTSRKKKRLLNYCKAQCKKIDQSDEVESAVVFKARLIPPGKGRLLKERDVHIAKFDVIVLIEIKDVSVESEIRSGKYFKQMEQEIKKVAVNTLFLSASNVKKIGPVDHKKQGVFLFNFFYADRLEQNIGIWEYTAGWFQQETGLDNSTLFLPDNHNQLDYKVINHCRWDKMSDIIPSILFKKSFRAYVLDNFYANNVAATPILYKLA